MSKLLTRNRVIGTLLLISWTLNVALGVALYFSNHPRAFPRRPFGHQFGHSGDETAPPPGIPLEFREALREGVDSLMDEQHCIAQELYATLVADSLDTTRLRLLTDSLGEMRCQIQKTMISKIAGLHDKLSPEEWKKICSRMVGRIGGERHDREFRHRDKD